MRAKSPPNSENLAKPESRSKMFHVEQLGAVDEMKKLRVKECSTWNEGVMQTLSSGVSFPTKQPRKATTDSMIAFTVPRETISLRPSLRHWLLESPLSDEYESPQRVGKRFGFFPCPPFE